MDGARVLLNDQAQALYTNTLVVPYLQRANRELELELINNGAEVTRQQSAVISVAAAPTAQNISITLPADFLLPTSIHERNQGATNDQWNEMVERAWEPENVVPTNDLRYWAFRNNAIYTPGVQIAKDVLLKYDRQLAIITGPASPEDFILSQNFLEAKTAELCARYIGMNKEFADDLAGLEVAIAKDNLMRAFVLNSQGAPSRRQRFTTKRYR